MESQNFWHNLLPNYTSFWSLILCWEKERITHLSLFSQLSRLKLCPTRPQGHSQHLRCPSSHSPLRVRCRSAWGSRAEGWFPAAVLSLQLLTVPPRRSFPARCCPLQLRHPWPQSLRSVPSSPWHGSPTAPGVQQHIPFLVPFPHLCFQVFPAADGPLQVLPVWGPCCASIWAIAVSPAQSWCWWELPGRAQGALWPLPHCSPE